MAGTDPGVTDGALDRAAAAIRDGGLVVYPTDTVYGLAADALTPSAIERVFAAKDRPRDRPLSLAAPTVETALGYVVATDLCETCMRTFLPGPVTVVCRRADHVPPALTGGRDRVGIRVPDHAVARALLRRVEPVTATSANTSGADSVTRIGNLDPGIRQAVAVILNAGETPGIESTVVDPDRGEVIRRGAMAADVARWLDSVEE